MKIFTILYERQNKSPVAERRYNPGPNVSDLVKNSSLVRTRRLNIVNPFVTPSLKLRFQDITITGANNA